MMRRSRNLAAASVAAVLLVAAAGCGDDDNGGDDVAAYCDFSAELDEAEGLPSDDDLDRIADLAPDEIRDDMELVVEEIKDRGEDAFLDEGNEDFFAALEEIEAFDEANCGRDVPDGEEDQPDADE